MTNAPSSATILVNPAARQVRARFDADAARRYLERRGLTVRLEVPGSPAALAAAAADAAGRGDELLFVAGGDGTLRLAAGAIAGTATALAALPGGTANVWVKEAGIPGRFRDAVDAHLAGQTVPMDLGRANGQPFILMAGIGWDAAIAGHVNARLKQRIGPTAYIVRGLLDLPGLRTAPLEWHLNGRSRADSVAAMVVSNTRLYGGLVEFAPQALADDGRLDVCVLAPRTIADAARLAVSLVRRRLTNERTQGVEITTAGAPYQLDGDPAGVTPLHISVEPKALRVRVPSGPLPPVLSGGC